MVRKETVVGDDIREQELSLQDTVRNRAFVPGPWEAMGHST